VFCVSHSVSPVVPTGIDRQHFGLAPDRFTFLFAFDVLSVMERKNPLGLIRAFNLAFGSSTNCRLVIKVNNAAARPKAIETLRHAAASSPAIHILDGRFSQDEMYALTQCSDCVVSLHRSEGFRLLIAEAMCLGKPVIVTNYSRNMDFTCPDNSLLVDHQTVCPRRAGGLYVRRSVRKPWAWRCGSVRSRVNPPAATPPPCNPTCPSAEPDTRDLRQGERGVRHLGHQ